jgi:hypothetical protein
MEKTLLKIDQFDRKKTTVEKILPTYFAANHLLLTTVY